MSIRELAKLEVRDTASMHEDISRRREPLQFSLSVLKIASNLLFSPLPKTFSYAS
jgi:hypothetical protein